MEVIHQSVLLQPALSYLSVQPGEWYIDATLGSGGHTLEILKQGGNVLGLDRDKDAIVRARQRLMEAVPELHEGTHYHLRHAAFSRLTEIADGLKIKQVSGVLFDLGVSTDQLVTPERGFSFRAESSLDMRMDRDQPITAETIINTYSEKRLYEIFHFWADEKRARQLALAVVNARQVSPIVTTLQLAHLAEEVYGGRQRVDGIHPATKMFQAVRMAVNQEIEELMAALPQAWQALKPGGKLVVISFHSGEDRVVKHFLTYAAETWKSELITKKPITPDQTELLANPKARSAKLRAIKK